jgi:SPP1 gp7 family putative phage head morphogenesis protein
MSMQELANQQEANLIEREKQVKLFEERLRKAYELAEANIEKEIEAFYGKYATDNRISYQEAKKRLGGNELKSFKAELENYLYEAKNFDLHKTSPEYMQRLDELSKRVYITRLEEIQFKIRSELEVLAGKQVKQMQEVLESGYSESYKKATYSVQKELGFGVEFTAVDGEQLAKAVQGEYLEMSFSKRALERKDKLVQQLDILLPQEFIRGRGSEAVTRDLRKQVDISYRSAEMLVRTEMNNVANQGTLQAYKDQGVTQYKYHATLDNRTSKICAFLDGMVFNIKDAKRGVNYPPMHPRCRSTTIPQLSERIERELVTSGMMRIARAKDKKTYYVPYNMTYKEWAQEHLEDSSK